MSLCACDCIRHFALSINFNSALCNVDINCLVINENLKNQDAFEIRETCFSCEGPIDCIGSHFTYVAIGYTIFLWLVSWH